jgi:hypothetical protein
VFQKRQRPSIPGTAWQLAGEPALALTWIVVQSRCAVPVCDLFRSPSRSFRRTCGSRSMLRTYPAFIPCSATSQNWFPIRLSPTGVRRDFPLLRPWFRATRIPAAADQSKQGYQLNARLPSCFSFFGSRLDAMAFHPFDANSFAVARPKPDEAPVMKIALWSWLVMTDPPVRHHKGAAWRHQSIGQLGRFRPSARVFFRLANRRRIQ